MTQRDSLENKIISSNTKKLINNNIRMEKGGPSTLSPVQREIDNHYCNKMKNIKELNEQELHYRSCCHTMKTTVVKM